MELDAMAISNAVIALEDSSQKHACVIAIRDYLIDNNGTESEIQEWQNYLNSVSK